MAFPKIGNLAPKFSLQNHEDKTVSLSDFKGESSVVVYFYPKAMTPGCTIQAQGLRDSANALKGLIIGQFTMEEYMTYTQNSSKLNKRMMNLVITRLQDQLQLLVPQTLSKVG